MSWSAAHLVELAVLGVLVGAINSTGGGGGLIVYPALVAFGVPALTANHTNTIAQSPSYLAIAGGYRRELVTQKARIRRFIAPALIGAGMGLAALELAPAGAFRVIAPGMIVLGSLLVALQPRITRALQRREMVATPHAPTNFAVAITCAYAAYFGIAAGVVLLGVLAIAITDTIQSVNAINRLLIALVNVIALIVFVAIGPVSWPPVAVLVPSTSLGGLLGVSIIRRLHPEWVRRAHLAIGIAASAYMILTVWA